MSRSKSHFSGELGSNRRGYPRNLAILLIDTDEQGIFMTSILGFLLQSVG